MNASSGAGAGGWPAVSWEAWREKVAPAGENDFERLVSTVDGELVIEPLFSADHAAGGSSSGLPGVAPFLRGPAWPAAGSSWRAGAEIDDEDPERARAEAARAAEEGATLLRLRVGRGDPGAGPGLRPRGGADFAQLVSSIPSGAVELHLDAGPDAVAAAAALLAAWRAPEDREEGPAGCLGLDPLAELAAFGSVAGGVERRFDLQADALRWCSSRAPRLRAARVSSLPLEEAGASAALALGYALAAGVETLRQLERRGIDVEAAASGLSMSCGVGRDIFVEISRLRAWRGCWHRVLTAAGIPDPPPAEIHLVSLRRRRTLHDAPVNLLRGTLETFVAAAGGAASLTLLAYDERRADRGAEGRRRARTTQAVAREEARLDWVADPAGGSWYVEALTRQLAEKAWAHFQSIESGGGALAALLDGSLQARVARQCAERREEISRRSLPLTGVSRFPPGDEAPVTPRAAALPQTGSGATPAGDGQDGAPPSFEALLERARRGEGMDALRAAAAGEGEATTCEPLVPEVEAAPFEALRARSDRHLAATGERPRVLLVPLGPLAEHGARRTFSINLLASGGIGVVEAAPGALPTPPPAVAVLCGTDERYTAQAAVAAAALGASGVSRVLLAGAADASIAGIDPGLCLREGIDVVETLASVLDLLGVER